MGCTARIPPAALCLLLLSACNRSAPRSVEAASPPEVPKTAPRATREIRVTGVIQAVHAVKVVVPMIQGQNTNMTLTQLVPNGTQVKQGDLVATFDPTQQLDAARDAKARFEDLSHQVDQRVAENRTNAAKRAVDLRQAEADLKNAQYELEKEVVLGRIELEEDRVKKAAAATHLESLRKSQAFHDKSEAAGLRILELQRDRQKINMQRAQDNIEKLEIHAPLAGMLVLEFTYRAGTNGHAQVGDQLYRSYPLASIFDPSEMQVKCSINEPDILALESGAKAMVTLDAYPDITLPAHFVYASPVASSGLGTPIKLFLALFHVDKTDPLLLPDLSAAVVLTIPSAAAPAGGSQ